MNQESKICQNCEHQFTIEPDDFAFYEKMKVPPPTWCPECRMIRRFVWKNDHHLFRRPDVASGKEMFSGFNRSIPAQIYQLDYWNSDAWDPLSYGREYDFDRPFFEQFRELLYAAPWPAKSVLRMVDSEYCDQASDFKNSYLCFSASGTENSAYMVLGNFSKESFDGYEVRQSELCYENVMVDESYKVFFSLDCDQCTDVWFSRDLIGCNNCFGCVGLRKKSYHIFNKPYTKEAYAEKLKEFQLDSHAGIQKIKKTAQEFWLKFPVKFMHGLKNVNSTGEHMHHSKNVHHSFDIHGGENMKYCQFVSPPASDAYDYTVWGKGISEMYECVTCGEQESRLKFCFESWPGCTNLEYSAFCRSSSDLFGCVGLKKKRYCILNKQYTKEEYFALREKIIAHMNEMPYISETKNKELGTKQLVYRYGEFFPPEFSPYAYNETIAQDFFTLSKAEAESKGFRWRDPEAKEYQITIDSADLPDRIQEVNDSILKEIIKCGECGKAYHVIEMELAFLRRMQLPLPRRCVQCRFKERFQFVNPPKFWHAKCHCDGTQSAYVNTAKHFHGETPCPNEFETSYSPERKEIVYCEKCYQSEVV